MGNCIQGRKKKCKAETMHCQVDETAGNRPYKTRYIGSLVAAGFPVVGDQ